MVPAAQARQRRSASPAKTHMRELTAALPLSIEVRDRICVTCAYSYSLKAETTNSTGKDWSQGWHLSPQRSQSRLFSLSAMWASFIWVAASDGGLTYCSCAPLPCTGRSEACLLGIQVRSFLCWVIKLLIRIRTRVSYLPRKFLLRHSDLHVRSVASFFLGKVSSAHR